MQRTIGQTLRAAREATGLNLLDVAHKTRIPANRLQQLEDDNYAAFGSMAYAKSFLKTYSRFLHVDASDVLLECLVNGEVRQSARTSDMLFSPYELVSFVSHVMTLVPGDVILTGTPGGISELHQGDTVEVRIESVGSLVNTVVAGEA